MMASAPEFTRLHLHLSDIAKRLQQRQMQLQNNKKIQSENVGEKEDRDGMSSTGKLRKSLPKTSTAPTIVMFAMPKYFDPYQLREVCIARNPPKEHAVFIKTIKVDADDDKIGEKWYDVVEEPIPAEQTGLTMAAFSTSTCEENSNKYVKNETELSDDSDNDQVKSRQKKRLKTDQRQDGSVKRGKNNAEHPFVLPITRFIKVIERVDKVLCEDHNERIDMMQMSNQLECPPENPEFVTLRQPEFVGKWLPIGFTDDLRGNRNGTMWVQRERARTALLKPSIETSASPIARHHSHRSSKKQKR